MSTTPKEYDMSTNDDLPPLPKPDWAPSMPNMPYSHGQMQSYARAAIAADKAKRGGWIDACGCQLGTCESKLTGCRMADEVKPGSGSTPQQPNPLTLAQCRALVADHLENGEMTGDDLTLIRAVEKAHSIDYRQPRLKEQT